MAVIHYDVKSPENLKKFSTRISEHYENILTIPSINCSWAGFSQVQVYLNSIRAALSHNVDWSHVVFLSEQHLPLKHPDEIASILSQTRSLVPAYQTSQMTGYPRADIESRFSACYKELPGVGGFAIDIVDRSEEFYDDIYHGSNWIVLSRQHCEILLNEDSKGAFDIFRTSIHADECAIQSVLESHISSHENKETTVVALPHLTDNSNLIMTDNLYNESSQSDRLFIRKRQAKLSYEVEKSIIDRHFKCGIYFEYLRSKESLTTSASQSSATCVERIYEILKQLAGFNIAVHNHCRNENLSGTLINILITVPDFAENLTIRIVSEDKENFKACLLESFDFKGYFERPSIQKNALVALARVRTYGVFAQRDIIPLDLESKGFFSLKDDHDSADMIEIVRRLIIFGKHWSS
ncbi:beta-1,6-N-acetylglucosaminyltransferase [Methylobacterium aquaticum]|uniref:beta-1,6-N-acetylglucosaminyltransferase n=1 Tax=Methylobacterium aquaticum TaxID=270351 RepID=UPI001932865E|nr:beta-1,6-N-acetylglucosaminyltransferase [Methylobacterium aquaticum]